MLICAMEKSGLGTLPRFRPGVWFGGFLVSVPPIPPIIVGKLSTTRTALTSESAQDDDGEVFLSPLVLE